MISEKKKKLTWLCETHDDGQGFERGNLQKIRVTCRIRTYAPEGTAYAIGWSIAGQRVNHSAKVTWQCCLPGPSFGEFTCLGKDVVGERVRYSQPADSKIILIAKQINIFRIIVS